MPNIDVITAEDAFARLVVHEQVPEQSHIVFLNPFKINFSQNVIYPKFTDGRNVDDAVPLIQSTSYTPTKEGDNDCESNKDGKSLLLKPPFASIKAVRWSPKLRDGRGRPIGENRGTEGLFSTDNRRLYCLQRAAVALWPKQCVVEVEVIMDRAEIMKQVKKFRTRTNGMSITITEWDGIGRDNAKDFHALRVWDWRSAIDSAADASPATGTKGLSIACDKGGIGCWEYLDNKDKVRGPFSNWQMRQWWEMKMLPQNLRVRSYSATAALQEGACAGQSNGQFSNPALDLMDSRRLSVPSQAKEPPAAPPQVKVSDPVLDLMDSRRLAAPSQAKELPAVPPQARVSDPALDLMDSRRLAAPSQAKELPAAPPQARVSDPVLDLMDSRRLSAPSQAKELPAAPPQAKTGAPFIPVLDLFAKAPCAFSPGFCPEADVAEGFIDWKVCAQCDRQRLQGWEAYGQWFCVACWKKWEREPQSTSDDVPA